MHGDGGKGSDRRPMAIGDQQYRQRWDLIFGKDRDEKVLAGDEDIAEQQQRIHELDDKDGKRDGER
jgi:hypothetical protein